MITKKIIFLVGPTAVGKSKVAVRLAKVLNAEIISCDSMQVYKGMDIGTQKPSLELRKEVRHHMIDILTPAQEFNAADFRKRALRIIREIHNRNKIPLLVGGTGLYMKVLIDGLFPSPPKDEKLRRKLYMEEKKRCGSLYEKLERIDPATAKKIHPNDTKKIVRALEVYYTTKKRISELKGKTRPLSDKFDVTIFGLIRPRQELYERIDGRVDRMFEAGFLNEVKKLSKKRLSVTAAQAIGYKEAIEYLRDKDNKAKEGLKRKDKGKIREDKGMIREDKGVEGLDKGIEGLKELIKKNTRRYAKRQLTWFRRDKRVVWVDISGVDG